ncbi:MAG: hypothetical protein HY700_21995 [Gemmatimonadetes bacterium]|nr:hypothetical protein [Gemmatimonadota bacterium]
MHAFHKGLMSAVLVLTWAVAAHAQTPYEDVGGHFMLDVPSGWSKGTVPQPGITTFSRSGAPTFQVLWGGGGRDSAFRALVNNAVGAGLGEPPAGAAFDLEVNGNQARWAEYTATYRDRQVSAALGAVALPEGTAMFMAFYPAETPAEHRTALKNAFQSLRVIGAFATGVANQRPAAPIAIDATRASGAADSNPPAPAAPPAAAPPASIAPTPFANEHVALTLPAGWTTKPVTGAAVVFLAHPTNGTVQFLGLKVKGKQKRETILEGLRSGTQSKMPSMKVVRRQELTTTSGVKMLTEELSGALTVEGREVPQVALIGAADGGRNWSFICVVAMSLASEDARRDVLAIIQSLRVP